MGTSSDYRGGTGGAWSPLKRAATSYAKHGGSGRAERVLARHVAALGGVSGATRSARSAVSGGTRFAGILAGVARAGLTATLQELGLDYLVGRNRFDVVLELIDVIAGAGSDLEGQAARAAALDVIDELFAGADSFDDLAEVSLDAAGLVQALEAFIARYIYNRLIPVLDERLARHTEPRRAEQLEEDLLQLIRAQVHIDLREVEALAVDWTGSDGQQFIEATLRSAYRVLEQLEG